MAEISNSGAGGGDGGRPTGKPEARTGVMTT
jgi:hypothetical protein